VQKPKTTRTVKAATKPASTPPKPKPASTPTKPKPKPKPPVKPGRK
jgi:hypothetical protein